MTHGIRSNADAQHARQMCHCHAVSSARHPAMTVILGPCADYTSRSGPRRQELVGAGSLPHKAIRYQGTAWRSARRSRRAARFPVARLLPQCLGLHLLGPRRGAKVTAQYDSNGAGVRWHTCPVVFLRGIEQLQSSMTPLKPSPAHVSVSRRRLASGAMDAQRACRESEHHGSC